MVDVFPKDFSTFGSFGVLLTLAVVLLGSVTNLQMDLFVRRSQCVVDGLLLTFCVYLHRRARLVQLSQLSLDRQLIQS